MFFTHMEVLIEESLVVTDDRIHGASQTSQWVSINGLIKKTSARCPENSHINFKDLVLYMTKCLKFYFPSSGTTQRGQLLASHLDDHYCTPLFKYFKIKAVKEKYYVMASCRDDKSSIHVGETDATVSTGVRGDENITPMSVTLEALSHDLHKSFLTSNVLLQCDIPASTDKSFVRGNVNYTVSDSVFQSSSPFRHRVMLSKIIKELEHAPLILMKYTDGATD